MSGFNKSTKTVVNYTLSKPQTQNLGRLHRRLFEVLSSLLLSNNKGADQPAPLRSLISAFVFILQNIICDSCFMRAGRQILLLELRAPLKHWY